MFKHIARFIRFHEWWYSADVDDTALVERLLVLFCFFQELPLLVRLSLALALIGRFRHSGRCDGGDYLGQRSRPRKLQEMVSRLDSSRRVVLNNEQREYVLYTIVRTLTFTVRTALPVRCKNALAMQRIRVFLNHHSLERGLERLFGLYNNTVTSYTLHILQAYNLKVVSRNKKSQNKTCKKQPRQPPPLLDSLSPSPGSIST